jgi:F0F1-type ATP synthase delta subunit
MLDKNASKKKVEIISPIELNFENKSNILFKLEHKLNCEIIPKWTIDESIIAGLVYKFDDYVIDTSIRAKLKDFSKVINR